MKPILLLLLPALFSFHALGGQFDGRWVRLASKCSDESTWPQADTQFSWIIDVNTATGTMLSLVKASGCELTWIDSISQADGQITTCELAGHVSADNCPGDATKEIIKGNQEKKCKAATLHFPAQDTVELTESPDSEDKLCPHGRDIILKRSDRQ